jgi:hypothetical protein
MNVTVGSRYRTLVAMLFGLVGCALACALVAPTAAHAAPYSTKPTLSVSVTDPCQEAILVVQGDGFQPGPVELRINNDVIVQAQAGADGTFTVRLPLPAGAVGPTTIVATGAGAGNSASTLVTINAACTAGEVLHNGGGGASASSSAGALGSGGANGGGANGGGLSSTGVAVAALLVLALGLIVGGTVLLVGSRRRVARTT